jgi:hypothetical protein
VSTEAPRFTRRDKIVAAIAAGTGATLGAASTATAFFTAGDMATVVGALILGVIAGAVATATIRENEDTHWRGLYTARGQQLTALDAELVRARGEAATAQRDADNLRKAAAVLQRQLDAERAKHTP